MSNKHLSLQLQKALDDIVELNKQIDSLKNANKRLSDEIKNSKVEVKSSIDIKRVEQLNVTTTEQENIVNANDDLNFENERLRKQINLLQAELNSAKQELNVCRHLEFLKNFI